MPKEQTSIERVMYFIQYGDRKRATLIVPFHPDEGQDNGYFENRSVEMVSVPLSDLEELLALANMGAHAK